MNVSKRKYKCCVKYPLPLSLKVLQGEIVLAKVKFPFYVTTLTIGRAALYTVVLVSCLAAVNIPNWSL